MGIEVTGVRQLQQAVTTFEGRIDKETVKILRQAAVRVRKRQKQLAPKEDGDLTRSITYRIRGTRWRRTAEIGPKMSEKYPLYQEVGTARMRANPYVAPSIEGEDARLADGLDGIVERSYR